MLELSNKLHIYIDGTPNGTDGTEVTELTLKNLKKYMTYSGNLSPYAYLICYMRFEDDYKGDVVVNSLLNYNNNPNSIGFYLVPFGTSYPTSRKDSGITFTANVTSKNYAFLVGMNTGYAQNWLGVDVPLQDMLSFSYVLEKA